MKHRYWAKIKIKSSPLAILKIKMFITNLTILMAEDSYPSFICWVIGYVNPIDSSSFLIPNITLVIRNIKVNAIAIW